MELEQLSYNAIVGAINSHAEVRPYDLDMYKITCVGVAVSLVAVLLSAWLNWKQSKFLKEQNKIALLEKRYDVFSQVERFIQNARAIVKLYHTDDTISNKFIFNALFQNIPCFDKENSISEKFKFLASQIRKLELLFRITENDKEFLTSLRKATILIQEAYLRDELIHKVSTIKYNELMQNNNDSYIIGKIDKSLHCLSLIEKIRLISKGDCDNRFLEKLEDQMNTNKLK